MFFFLHISIHYQRIQLFIIVTTPCSVLTLCPTSLRLDAFVRKMLSAFVCRRVCCEYFIPSRAHVRAYNFVCATGVQHASHVSLFSSSLCECIKNKQSSSQAEGLGRIVSRVLLMIITVERVSLGTVGQLPACLPFCHTEIRNLMFSFRAEMQHSRLFYHCQVLCSIIDLTQQNEARLGVS